jgi:Tol biopolymer transport system component
MSLQVGTRIGSYEITAPIGAGGMGEVYRARDTKLNRDVAIKVLPASFARNADGVARFRREAQVLASLNHPNIASIYGLEETNGDLALALELVDGEDLAERLKRGLLPLDEALAIAKQLAQGLQAAPEQRVIHRDLKRANIKLTKNGITKILDFGLAKAYEGDTGAAEGGVSQSPTISRQMTEAGMILGTAAYMSPEQARGKPVDKRADIWAFGVVLFEMLTGRRLFSGETVSDTLAAVLTRDPDWATLPSSTPPGVRRVLKRCLARDPTMRLRDIGDVYPDLDEVEDVAPVAGAASVPNTRRRAWPWAIAVALLVAAWPSLRRAGTETTAPGVMHLDVVYPPNVEPVSGLQGGFAVSPDGQAVAMIGVRDGVRRLYVRRLDRPEPTEISDTAGANSARFSPDGASVAFIPGSGHVTRISLADQQRTVVAPGADLDTGFGWNSAGFIFGRSGALWVVPPQGGAPRQLTVLDAARHEVLHDDPVALPGGRTVLFSSLTMEPGTERVEAVAIDGGQRSVVVERAITPIWSPTGHLVFGRDGAVWAVPFDPESATVRGSAVPVIPSGVVGTVRSGSLGLQLSSTGTLLFVPNDFDHKRVLSIGRDGSEAALNLPPDRYSNPRVSPDGRRLLVESQGNVIVTLDLARGTGAKLAAAAIGTSFCTWTADGEGVVFRRFSVPFWAAADGSGRAGPVPAALTNDFPSSPGPDADSIFAVRIQPETSGDIFLLSISGKFQPKPLLVTPAYEGGPQLSPDGRWLLYQSNASGQPEIYVRRYPAMDRQWQVSEGGGLQARWSRTAREIFYRTGQRIMAVTFDPSRAQPAFGKPAVLFPDEYDFGQGISIANYDVTRDGRFIMLRRGTHGSSLRVVIHWTEELKRILAAGGVR